MELSALCEAECAFRKNAADDADWRGGVELVLSELVRNVARVAADLSALQTRAGAWDTCAKAAQQTRTEARPATHTTVVALEERLEAVESAVQDSIAVPLPTGPPSPPAARADVEALEARVAALEAAVASKPVSVPSAPQVPPPPPSVHDSTPPGRGSEMVPPPPAQVSDGGKSLGTSSLASCGPVAASVGGAACGADTPRLTVLQGSSQPPSRSVSAASVPSNDGIARRAHDTPAPASFAYNKENFAPPHAARALPTHDGPHAKQARHAMHPLSDHTRSHNINAGTVLGSAFKCLPHDVKALDVSEKAPGQARRAGEQRRPPAPAPAHTSCWSATERTYPRPLRAAASPVASPRSYDGQRSTRDAGWEVRGARPQRDAVSDVRAGQRLHVDGERTGAARTYRSGGVHGDTSGRGSAAERAFTPRQTRRERDRERDDARARSGSHGQRGKRFRSRGREEERHAGCDTPSRWGSMDGRKDEGAGVPHDAPTSTAAPAPAPARDDAGASAAQRSHSRGRLGAAFPAPLHRASPSRRQTPTRASPWPDLSASTCPEAF